MGFTGQMTQPTVSKVKR